MIGLIIGFIQLVALKLDLVFAINSMFLWYLFSAGGGLILLYIGKNGLEFINATFSPDPERAMEYPEEGLLKLQGVSEKEMTNVNFLHLLSSVFFMAGMVSLREALTHGIESNDFLLSTLFVLLGSATQAATLDYLLRAAWLTPAKS